MMARIMTTTQKKNTMMPAMAYPATVLVLATATTAQITRIGAILGGHLDDQVADHIGGPRAVAAASDYDAA
jgi:hypothetical protein